MYYLGETFYLKEATFIISFSSVYFFCASFGFFTEALKMSCAIFFRLKSLGYTLNAYITNIRKSSVFFLILGIWLFI